MTDKTRSTVNRISAVLGIMITVVTLIAGGVRVVDLTTQTAQTVEKLSMRLDKETTERIAEGRVLADAITKEREDRNAGYVEIKVKLTEIDTRLLYIQQGVDSLNR